MSKIILQWNLTYDSRAQVLEWVRFILLNKFGQWLWISAEILILNFKKIEKKMLKPSLNTLKIKFTLKKPTFNHCLFLLINNSNRFLEICCKCTKRINWINDNSPNAQNSHSLSSHNPIEWEKSAANDTTYEIVLHKQNVHSNTYVAVGVCECVFINWLRFFGILCVFFLCIEREAKSFERKSSRTKPNICV